MCEIVGQMTDELQNFLEANLPKVKESKKPKYSLGVAEPKLGSIIMKDMLIFVELINYISTA